MVLIRNNDILKCREEYKYNIGEIINIKPFKLGQVIIKALSELTIIIFKPLLINYLNLN